MWGPSRSRTRGAKKMGSVWSKLVPIILEVLRSGAEQRGADNIGGKAAATGCRGWGRGRGEAGLNPTNTPRKMVLAKNCRAPQVPLAAHADFGVKLPPELGGFLGAGDKRGAGGPPGGSRRRSQALWGLGRSRADPPGQGDGVVGGSPCFIPPPRQDDAEQFLFAAGHTAPPRLLPVLGARI